MSTDQFFKQDLELVEDKKSDISCLDPNYYEESYIKEGFHNLTPNCLFDCASWYMVPIVNGVALDRLVFLCD